ncbi:50S ribosomal protein L5 [Patescibacteria group bacterium]|nr:MAG: 50S ribosomal protein L5 [Patescibacteria group bacterium]
MTKILSTKERYQVQVVPAMMEAFQYTNQMAVPKIQKIVLNVGIGKIQKETERIEEIMNVLRQISGQNPVKTKSRKAISGFKIREGLEIGVKVTLRGKRMWDFLDRLINVALPRTRDFQGIPFSGIDQGGCLNIGIKEHTIFPEVVLERVKNIFSLQVNVVTNAKSQAEGEVLFRGLGFPIRQRDKK